MVLVVSAFFLISPYALYGASIAFMLGNFSLFLYRFYHVKRYVKLRIDIKILLLFIISLLVVLYLSLVFKPPYGALLAMVFAGVVTMIFNKEDLLKMMKTVQRKIGNN